MTAIVTCGHTKAGLAAARALGRSGLAVAVAAPMRPALAMWSRFTTSTFLLPDARTSAERFARSVREEAAGRKVQAVLTATDEAVLALSKARDTQPPAVTRLLPPHDGLLRARDRGALHDLAGSIGLCCLETIRVDASAAVEPALLEAQRRGFPALVRPQVKAEVSVERAEPIRVAKVGELRRLLYAREDLVDDGCLIEPRPPGRFVTYATVMTKSGPACEVFQERIRERAPMSNLSTFVETVPPDEEVRRGALRLLEALAWRGPAAVEFLRDERDGVLRLVGVIGRLWASVQLAVNAGVDIPMLCYRMAGGEPLGPVRTARPGVRLRWVVGDLQQALFRAAGGFDPVEGGLALWRRAKALLELGDPRDLRRISTDIFDPRDPMPFVFELQNLLQRRA